MDVLSYKNDLYDQYHIWQRVQVVLINDTFFFFYDLLEKKSPILHVYKK